MKEKNGDLKIKPPLRKIIAFSILIFFCLWMSYSFYAYNDIITDFKTAFDNKDYSKANSIIVSKGTLNPAKDLLLYSDLKNYFSSYIDDLMANYKNNKLSDELALSSLNEVQRYDIVNAKVSEAKKSIPLLTDSSNNFSLGIKLIKDKSYEEAFNALNKVSNFDDNFIEAQQYKKEVINAIKNQTLSSAEQLVSENYFSKAIDMLEDNVKYYSNDKDVLGKIDEYKQERTDFLNKGSTSKKSSISSNSTSSNTTSNTDSELASTSVAAMTINTSTINTLNLTSDTSYLVYVNLASQKTYVFKGKKNSWNLVENFSCSTGVSGSETPSGIFTVKEKGDWFYSDEYNEGAKYWVQFEGNYLFHSLPYNSTKTKITDYTLGKAASHGCVRLKVDEAKWLYDNVSKGSKVIIN